MFTAVEYDANCIQKILDYHNITQAELAQKIDVKHQVISQWVMGKHAPSMKNAAKIISVTGASPTIFFKAK